MYIFAIKNAKKDEKKINTRGGYDTLVSPPKIANN